MEWNGKWKRKNSLVLGGMEKNGMENFHTCQGEWKNSGMEMECKIEWKFFAWDKWNGNRMDNFHS